MWEKHMTLFWTLVWFGVTAISAFFIGRAYEVLLETKRLLREKERIETEIDEIVDRLREKERIETEIDEIVDSTPTRKGPDA